MFGCSGGDWHAQVARQTPSYRFTGTTEVGASVVAAGLYPAEVEPDGEWSIVLTLQPGRNVASFAAIDGAGNETALEIPVFYEIPMAELIVGSWIGEVTVPCGWQPITDFWVEFRADGSYSADAGGEPPFSHGYPNDDYPEKVFTVDGQPGSGWITIVWDDDGSVTTQQGSLENISFSNGGDRLQFEFWATWGGRMGPIEYDLRRGTLPPPIWRDTTHGERAQVAGRDRPSGSWALLMRANPETKGEGAISTAVSLCDTDWGQAPLPGPPMCM